MSEQVGIPNSMVLQSISRGIDYYRNTDLVPKSRYFSFQDAGGQLGTYIVLPNLIVCTPIITTKTLNLYNWAFRVTTAQAGRVVKCAIYGNSLGTLYPTNLLYTLEALSTGVLGMVYSSLINIILRRNILLWLATWSNATTAQILSHAMSVDANITGFDNDPGAGEWATHGFTCPLAYTGAFPNPFPAWGGVPLVGKLSSSDNYPAIFIRFTNP